MSTPNPSILATPVSVKEYLQNEEKNGRAPPGLCNWLLSTGSNRYEPSPGDFFRATDGRVWRRSPDLRWEVSDE